MIARIFTVGGFTLLSRFTGFARDIVLAAVRNARGANYHPGIVVP